MDQKYSYFLIVGIVAVVALFVMFSGKTHTVSQDMIGNVPKGGPGGPDGQDGGRGGAIFVLPNPECNPDTCENCEDECLLLPDCGLDEFDNFKCKPTCGKAAGPTATFCPDLGLDPNKVFEAHDVPREGWVCYQGPCFSLNPECDDNNCAGCTNLDYCDWMHPVCGVSDYVPDLCVSECTHSGGFYNWGSACGEGYEIIDAYMLEGQGNICCRPTQECRPDNCVGCYDFFECENTANCDWIGGEDGHCQTI